MLTAIKGLLALAVLSAAIAVTTIPTHAQPMASGDTPSEETLYGEPEAVDLGTVTTTAYSLRGPMKSGVNTHYGAVAVDPRVIPLGSILYIEDLGYFVAEDTGGAVRGSHIDIWLSTRYEALGYGIQYRRAWLIS
jgi:3D (Asp-Asp-Asp) domain-containing protein